VIDHLYHLVQHAETSLGNSQITIKKWSKKGNILTSKLLIFFSGWGLRPTPQTPGSWGLCYSDPGGWGLCLRLLWSPAAVDFASGLHVGLFKLFLPRSRAPSFRNSCVRYTGTDPNQFRSISLQNASFFVNENDVKAKASSAPGPSWGRFQV